MPLVRATVEPRTYSLDGDEIPGVTDILRYAGYIDNDRYEMFGKGGFYRDRGQFIHEATELIDKGVSLDPASLEGYAGYAAAYVAAQDVVREWHGPIVSTTIEESRHSDVFWFAGTTDRRFLRLTNNAILDIKTAKQAAPWWAVQLAAYAILDGHYPDLAALQIGETGEFKLRPVTREVYIAASFKFLSALFALHRASKRPAKFMLAFATEAVAYLSELHRTYAVPTQQQRPTAA